ncbi:hypothetical protein [Lentzea aerocolonigenes]|uniref:hypothetical protein n=1 Tax=Lentzea aerocolonigenes TaxID=68170 RepID=UPI0004C387BB|nr:hypothetical protein [Lentzea aerocolonigenes]MCP2248187.1 hypothetical protein [Lentzea aerocolonigenes]
MPRAFEGFRVDRDGVAEILRSPELAAHVKALAEEVATAARLQGHRVTSGELLPVDVLHDPAPDRVGYTVAIKHPAGMGMEAKHGVLTRAAEALGLDVHGIDTHRDT